MRAHQVQNGVVINTIVVDSLDVIPGLIDASLGGAIGDLWDGEVFTTPPPDPTIAQAAARERATSAYKSMIRRRAARLSNGSAEDKYQAILLLKTIGE